MRPEFRYVVAEVYQHGEDFDEVGEAEEDEDVTAFAEGG
jgi:hypothetical protein